MPEFAYTKDNTWTKECTVCKTEFKVIAERWNDAHTALLKHFGYSKPKQDELKSQCRSCDSNTQHGRVNVHREELLAAQDGKCGICTKEISFEHKTAQIDHDHKTGKTRKVLCKLCNRHMAAVDDDEWIKLGIAYRDSFRCE